MVRLSSSTWAASALPPSFCSARNYDKTSSTACALLFLFVSCAFAQGGAHFDAASLKPASAVGLDQRLKIDGSLTSLIQQAFDVNQYQVSGGPSWMGKGLYAINASIVGPADHDQVMEMLRNLLIGRFHLKTHFETRQTKVYELTVAKSGLKADSHDGLFIGHTIPDLVRWLNGSSGPSAPGWRWSIAPPARAAAGTRAR